MEPCRQIEWRRMEPVHDFEESIQPNPFLKALLLDAVENQVRDKSYGQVPLHDAA